MQSADVFDQIAAVPEETREVKGYRYSSFIFCAFVLMAVLLIYVWCHIHMTELEYQLATEISTKEQLLEQQRRLRVEYATLKSPQRIEAIARDRLQMTFPQGDQIIVLK
ncbi:MAG: cell division protein FtsL [Smithellaceae bacterium]|nr:cell division protein FtsL [Smithellaceae bacterium]